MTNRLALALACLIALGLLADWFLADSAYSLFLAREFFALIDYIAFWR